MEKELLIEFTRLFAKYVMSICHQKDCENCPYYKGDYYCRFDGMPFEWEIE